MKHQIPSLEQRPEKLRELALYIAKESTSDPRFGKTKLTKLLFYCDFFAYGALGEPISGAKYEVWDLGPVLSRLYDFLEELTDSGDAAIQEQDCFGYSQHRLVSLREPRLKDFSGDEVALVNKVIRLFWEKNATEMSRDSHHQHAWKSFADGEEIPYTAVFLSSRKLTQREKDYALELAPTPLAQCA